MHPEQAARNGSGGFTITSGATHQHSLNYSNFYHESIKNNNWNTL